MKETVKEFPIWERDRHGAITFHGYHKVVKRTLEESDRVEEVLNILRGATTPEEVQKKYRITSLNSIDCRIVAWSDFGNTVSS